MRACSTQCVAVLGLPPATTWCCSAWESARRTRPPRHRTWPLFPVPARSAMPELCLHVRPENFEDGERYASLCAGLVWCSRAGMNMAMCTSVGRISSTASYAHRSSSARVGSLSRGLPALKRGALGHRRQVPLEWFMKGRSRRSKAGSFRTAPLPHVVLQCAPGRRTKTRPAPLKSSGSLPRPPDGPKVTEFVSVAILSLSQTTVRATS